MVNYSNGKVYKIEPINGDDGDVYFGSTTKQYLSQRMDSHRNNYKSYKNGYKSLLCGSFILFDKYGIENCNIVLLENVNAESKDQLTAREAYYIRNYKCVNKYIPLRKVKEYMDEYYIKNREKIVEKGKIYREINKEIISERMKKIYEANKEITSEKRKEKVTCECGSICRKDGLREHKKTIKHIDFINNQNSNPI